MPAEEYALLAPPERKAHIIENERTMIYLEREVYERLRRSGRPATTTPPPRKRNWDGYFKDAHMDFAVIKPFAATAEGGAWRKASWEKVKAYILAQL